MVDIEYQVGSALAPDNPTYVKREADEELFNELMSGEFCYVFNARQMGKTSLLLQMKDRLEKKGFACANIDIAGDIAVHFAGRFCSTGPAGTKNLDRAKDQG